MLQQVKITHEWFVAIKFLNEIKRTTVFAPYSSCLINLQLAKRLLDLKQQMFEK